MNEKELTKQRDIYWMLCMFLMAVILVLLVYIGGKNAVDPGKAMWKNFSLSDTTKIDTLHVSTINNHQ